jgi:diacylglycerol kinase family enzyme
MITVIYNEFSGTYSVSVIDKLERAIKKTLKDDQLIMRKTNKIGHAIDITTNVSANSLVVICGGDGIVHEAINGLYKRVNNDVILAICPMGSGNHCAKQLGIISTDVAIQRIINFLEKKEEHQLHLLRPTEVLAENNTRILSINTIISGPPLEVAKLANSIGKYLPGFLASLKYDLATIIYSFKYKVCNYTVGGIKGLNGFFIQTTKTCGNGMLIDKDASLSEKTVRMLGIFSTNFIYLMYQLLCIKMSINVKNVCRANFEEEVIIIGNGSVTIDGENKEFAMPCKIKRCETTFQIV